MLAQERYDLIARVLAEKNSIKVSEVMQLCDISHETARRDLEALQEQGLARRVHGGAVLVPQSGTASTASDSGRYSACTHSGNVAVAKAALSLVHAGDTILLDAGRTVSHLAHYIRDLPDLFVVTPNLLVINELRDGRVHLHGLAGELHHEEYAFTGKMTQTTFSAFNVDTAFISCAGLDLTQGYLTDYDDCGISRSLIREHSSRMVLLLNSDKLRIRAFSNLCPISILDTIIVDDRISPEHEEMLRSTGVEVIIAPMLGETDDAE
ncbi:MAG: DeoR/GlpR transcriptional regulator [Ruminococcaceae bacterium]|nr:DeoR/GlpR transcriptional regulator [Oscillospiraceae bacterium]